jgi:hypothetical protein
MKLKMVDTGQVFRTKGYLDVFASAPAFATYCVFADDTSPATTGSGRLPGPTVQNDHFSPWTAISSPRIVANCSASASPRAGGRASEASKIASVCSLGIYVQKLLADARHRWRI